MEESETLGVTISHLVELRDGVLQFHGLVSMYEVVSDYGEAKPIRVVLPRSAECGLRWRVTALTEY
jgi:hypothetical protein